jgi:putative flippase GtrA
MTKTQQIAKWWKSLEGDQKFGVISITFLSLLFLFLLILYPQVMLVVAFIAAIIASIVGVFIFFFNPPWNN